jgi:hypothetical protein
MNQSVRRTLTGAVVGAGLGYAASKGIFIDPAAPTQLAQQMAAHLPSTGAAVASGAAIGSALMGGYEAGKHRALNTKQFK